MLAQRLWHALQHLHDVLVGHYRPHLRAAVEAAGLAGQPVGTLLHAGDIDPLPLTAAGLWRCVPYYSAGALAARMEILCQGGWLHSSGDGDYHLTPAGRAAARAVYETVRACLAALAPLPAPQLDRLAHLAGRLAAACLASQQVTDQACVACSGTAGPNPEGAPLARVARDLEALTNFRCDAHRAAWLSTGASGPAWEALTLLWRGQADSAASVQAWSEQQAFPRGYGADIYARELAELAARGWLRPAGDGRWRLTAEGRRVRQAAEDDTDERFYAPWAGLSEAELLEAAGLAQQAAGVLSRLQYSAQSPA